MKLPQQFISKMEALLGPDFPHFLKSYEQPRLSGLRANGLKITPSDLQEALPYLEKQVPWCSDGFYYNDLEVRPGKSPLYSAGLYYIQEPSAMYPVELLDVKPGERVLDLCAAPGGKSAQIAARIGSKGLLVTNDLNQQRAKVLLKNIEKYGVSNAIVLNESPEKISQYFTGFFDKILVDAPCSGEGMFRKEPDMINSWSEDEVTKYVNWQREILAVAARLLRLGGELVYSTCTFSTGENEEQINNFLLAHPDFELSKVKRLWPHQIEGEGHFAAKLKRTGQAELEVSMHTEQFSRKNENSFILSAATEQALTDFSKQVWGNPDYWQRWLPEGGQLVERAGHILWESLTLPELRGLRILRSGWLLGTVEKGRFRPSQAFALGLPEEAVALAEQGLDLSSKSEEEYALAVRYLRGETIQQEGKTWSKGWYLLSIDGYPLGWAKSAGNWLKNEYPPGWRRMD